MRRSVLFLMSAALVAALAGPSPAAASTKPPVNYVATFGFPGSPETFRARLVEPSDIATAQRMMAGGLRLVPVGRVVYGSSDVNAGWTWHLDPATISFSVGAIEVCDGYPSAVEHHLITSEFYCPWQARISGLDPIPPGR